MLRRVRGLSPGPIWREFQPSKILAGITCLRWGQMSLKRKVRGCHFHCKSKHGQTRSVYVEKQGSPASTQRPTVIPQKRGSLFCFCFFFFFLKKFGGIFH